MHITSQPLVSVIVTSYNTEKYITEALESVFAQHYSNIEVIVVDDGSTDNTLDVLKRFSGKIKIISQKNSGQSAARNVGLKQAQGSLVGFLDGDDFWSKNHVSLALQYLGDNSDYDFVRGQTRCFRMLPDGKQEITDNIFMEMLVGASFFRAPVFKIVGLFDEEMRQGEDLDWFIRLAETGCKEKRIEETMLFYRKHEKSLTYSQDAVAQGQLDAYRKKIKRNKARLVS